MQKQRQRPPTPIVAPLRTATLAAALKRNMARRKNAAKSDMPGKRRPAPAKAAAHD